MAFSPTVVREWSTDTFIPNNCILSVCDCFDSFLLFLGAYGTVYKARDRVSDKIVAIKKVKLALTEDGVPMSVLREISLLKQLGKSNHPNIVRWWNSNFAFFASLCNMTIFCWLYLSWKQQRITVSPWLLSEWMKLGASFLLFTSHRDNRLCRFYGCQVLLKRKGSKTLFSLD